jgi:hypothetical protein
MAIDTTVPRSRRALLGAWLGAIAASVAATLGRAQPASAHDPDDVRLGAANSTIGATTITNTAMNGSALAGFASDAGSGIYGNSASGYGVYGSSSGTGVHGVSDTGYGVFAISVSGTGVSGTSPSGYGIYGSSGSDTLPALLAVSYRDNTGLQGYSGQNNPPASPARTGVFGSADQGASSVGIRGTSPAGRGGVFKGGAAQLKLVASSSASHPATGQLGDLFLDKNKRLWFCKGGTTWKQLA